MPWPCRWGRSVPRALLPPGLYEAGDFALDLRLDQEYGTTTVVLVGQISDRSQPTRKLTNLPVLLMSGGEILTRASSNQFGEFHLEYEPRGRLRLCAAVGTASVSRCRCTGSRPTVRTAKPCPSSGLSGSEEGKEGIGTTCGNE